MESIQQEMMNAENIKNKFFSQELDLDAVDNVSKITVPDFRDGRSGRFLHDFQNNETAIIDPDTRRCFVMPLDREHILPPQSLTDLIQKMYRGYYEIDTTVIRKTMRVVVPAIDDMSSISPKIEQACRGKNVYKLEPFVGGGEWRTFHWPMEYFNSNCLKISVVKRSIDDDVVHEFGEFSGIRINYRLTDIQQVENEERK